MINLNETRHTPVSLVKGGKKIDQDIQRVVQQRHTINNTVVISALAMILLIVIVVCITLVVYVKRRTALLHINDLGHNHSRLRPDRVVDPCQRQLGTAV